jgi:hypothetical protein
MLDTARHVIECIRQVLKVRWMTWQTWVYVLGIRVYVLGAV